MMLDFLSGIILIVETGSIKHIIVDVIKEIIEDIKILTEQKPSFYVQM
jgi:hypothetical protein